MCAFHHHVLALERSALVRAVGRHDPNPDAVPVREPGAGEGTSVASDKVVVHEPLAREVHEIAVRVGGRGRHDHIVAGVDRLGRSDRDAAHHRRSVDHTDLRAQRIARGETVACGYVNLDPRTLRHAAEVELGLVLAGDHSVHAPAVGDFGGVALRVSHDRLGAQAILHAGLAGLDAHVAHDGRPIGRAAARYRRQRCSLLWAFDVETGFRVARRARDRQQARAQSGAASARESIHLVPPPIAVPSWRRSTPSRTRRGQRCRPARFPERGSCRSSSGTAVSRSASVGG